MKKNFLSALLSLGAIPAISQVGVLPVRPIPPPVLRVADVGPMALQSMDIEATIVGLFARVETTMVFSNPNPREFSGELEFPLPDRGVVCGYALDIQGAMVEGVVVPKDEARVIFEAETRRQIDPGLVEQVRGNVFRTRVYPIPALGTRTVRITYTSPLVVSDQGASLWLPMPREKLAKRNVTLEVASLTPTAPTLTGLGDRRFEQASQFWRVESHETDLAPSEDILVALPALPETFTLHEKDELGNVWQCVVSLPKEEITPLQEGIPTDVVDIYWDASGSHTPTEAEFIALQTALHAWSPQSGYRLHFFRDTIEPVRQFESAKEALDAVKAFDAYDGGTSLQGLFDQISGDGIRLLFSDGLDTLSSPQQLSALQRVPNLLAFTAASTADFGLLRRLGTLVKLFDADTATRETQLGIREILKPAEVAATKALVDRVTLSGTGWNATLGKLEPEADAPKTILNGRILATAWAAARMEELSADPDANEDALLGLGRRYGIAGPKTSLLVLESLDQWVRYKIEPPASLPDLRKRWQEAMKNQSPDQNPEQKQARHVQRLKRLWNERIAWWEKDYSKDPPPNMNPPPTGGVLHRARNNDAMALADAAPMAIMEEGAVWEEAPTVGAPAPRGGRSMNFARSAAAEVAPLAKPAAGDVSEHASVEATASVVAWNPDVPYLKILQMSAKDELYATYLTVRKSHRDSPSFFLDCASFFFQQKETALAIRILTNLAELKIDDAALLRVLAWRLREAEAFDLAIVQLERIARLRPEDGQSFRDLALTLTERGKEHFARECFKEAAADLTKAGTLYQKVAFTPWERHADTLGLFALEEFNALAAWIAEVGLEDVVLPELPEEFCKRLSTDVRIIMEWDADDTDIDLHVVEPNGEEAFYGHNRTRRGGLVSRDITDGYGPEEYMIRRAPKGPYEISARYYGSHQQSLYGPVTVTATIYTNWGRKDEKRLSMSLRLDKTGDRIPIGSVSF